MWGVRSSGNDHVTALSAVIGVMGLSLLVALLVSTYTGADGAAPYLICGTIGFVLGFAAGRHLQNRLP